MSVMRGANLGAALVVDALSFDISWSSPATLPQTATRLVRQASPLKAS